MLIIHGGFWQAEWDRMHARPMAAALADAGYLVGSVEYRRIGSPGGGGWPGTFDDVAAAIDELPEMITAVAPDPLHLQGVVLVGHSAGGHLALWAAADIDCRPISRGTARTVRASAASSRSHPWPRWPGQTARRSAKAQLPTGRWRSQRAPDRYSMVDPSALAPVRRSASWSCTVPKIRSPGGAQPPVRRACRRRRRRHHVVELGGIEHYGLIDPLSPAWPAVLDAVRAVPSSR